MKPVVGRPTPSGAPALVLPNTTNTVTVLATNQGDYTDSFSVTLYDDTDVRLVGSNWVNKGYPTEKGQ